jgi:hypothetical protein
LNRRQEKERTTSHVIPNLKLLQRNARMLSHAPDQESSGGGRSVTLVGVGLDDDAFAEGGLVELLMLFGEVGVDPVL